MLTFVNVLIQHVIVGDKKNWEQTVKVSFMVHIFHESFFELRIETTYRLLLNALLKGYLLVKL